MRIPARFSLALLLAAFPLHAQETPDPIEFSQEEYNQRVAREMEEMNQALQAMSKFMVKSMNNMTEAINKSAPGIAQSMGELVKSMEPIIKAAQQNQDFAAQALETTASQPDAAANDVTRQFQGGLSPTSSGLQLSSGHPKIPEPAFLTVLLQLEFSSRRRQRYLLSASVRSFTSLSCSIVIIFLN